MWLATDIEDYNYEELGTHTGLEFMPTLPQLSKCWDYMCVLPHQEPWRCPGQPMPKEITQENRSERVLFLVFYLECGVKFTTCIVPHTVLLSTPCRQGGNRVFHIHIKN